MTRPPDLRRLSEARKDALIRDLWAMVQERDALIADLCKRVAELESKLGGPPKTPDNSSVPPSQGQKVNTPLGKAWAGKVHGQAEDPGEAHDPQATFCGSPRRVTASGDPVGGKTEPR